MTGRPGFVRPVLVAVIAGLTMIGEARAEVSCHKINAKGVGQDLGNLATQAEIIGGGLLHGTTAAQFAITGMSGTVFSIEGTVTFTTHQATLTVAVTGTFDVVSGEFSAAGPVSGATGKLEGATGTLTLQGVQDLSTGSFVEDVTGEICVDLSRGGG
jgi:hypothetical protein